MFCFCFYRTLARIFTLNYVVFVDKGRKNISCPKAQGALATSLGPYEVSIPWRRPYSDARTFLSQGAAENIKYKLRFALKLPSICINKKNSSIWKDLVCKMGVGSCTYFWLLNLNKVCG